MLRKERQSVWNSNPGMVSWCASTGACSSSHFHWEGTDRPCHSGTWSEWPESHPSSPHSQILKILSHCYPATATIKTLFSFMVCIIKNLKHHMTKLLFSLTCYSENAWKQMEDKFQIPIFMVRQIGIRKHQLPNTNIRVCLLKNQKTPTTKCMKF